MKEIPIWVVFILSFLLLRSANSVVEEEVKNSLINVLAKLNGTTNGQPDPSFGWNNASDPCQDRWKGVTCDSKSNSSVRKISLNNSNLAGVFDAASLCNVQPLAASLVVVKIDGNNIVGNLPDEIGNCRNLTRLLIGGNQFSGSLPNSLVNLNNLKRLDISYNKFSGNFPDQISRISGLTVFLAQHNQITGQIPEFDFSNLKQFNVSFNLLSGPIPDVMGRFPASSFMNNLDLCGSPLQKPCSPSISSAESDKNKKKGVSKDQILMYSGYAILALVIVIIIIYMLLNKAKAKQNCEAVNKVANKVASVDDSMNKPSAVSSDYKTGESRSGFSANSAESAVVSSSLIILTSPVVNGLRFDDLLRAPAELLGRGKHGSLYKVIYDNRMVLAVKRIKDWGISSNEFKHKMERIYQASHPHVLPALAFYCSKQEKLLIYEYQKNGSLFRFLQSTQMRQSFDWSSRLGVAARIAEALAFMHKELRDNGIPHGNLKSSNILLNNSMEPFISEYGLMTTDSQNSVSFNIVNDPQFAGRNQAGPSNAAFKEDTFGFGVILLELLTGKVVQSNGTDLAKWVHSVIREEWTVEVFDKSLILKGASEERMVSLLQVAIKCVNHSAEARPPISQVAVMINTIKEEDERSSAAYEP